MEGLMGFVRSPAATPIVRRSLFYASKSKKNSWLRAKLNAENDPLLQAATSAASLRFQEMHRPEPLFVDPYAGCLVHPDEQMDLKECSHQYCLATKFIDDKLLSTVNHIDGLKQVVLLTDGMDTRPYRLNWPTSTVIFDISLERIFKKSAEKLQGVGAKVPRNCLFLHVPLESSDIQHSLHAKGFNGNQPSIWAIQGLPVMTLANFKEFLLVASSLAMSGCLFLGELPAWLAETEIGIKVRFRLQNRLFFSFAFSQYARLYPVVWPLAQPSTEKWMNKLFMSNGFRVDFVGYDEVAKSLGKEESPGEYKNILFVAEQLQFSDDQMETWRRELQRVEEEGDEEGFEEL